MKGSSGRAVKIIAYVLGILGFIAAFGVAAMKGDRFDFALFTCTVVAALIVAVLFYGFGELIDNSAQMKQTIYEMNSHLRSLEAKIDALPAARPAAPDGNTEVPKAGAAEKKETIKPAVNELAPYETLDSAQEICERFCDLHKDKPGGDIDACIDRLRKIAQREKEGFGNSKNNALSLLKSFYKHGGRIYAVDRSEATFRCPVCNNKIFSDRRSCHQCGALFRL